jgi:hypothetical protein
MTYLVRMSSESQNRSLRLEIPQFERLIRGRRHDRRAVLRQRQIRDFARVTVAAEAMQRSAGLQTPDDQITIPRSGESLVVLQDYGDLGLGVEGDDPGRLRLPQVEDDEVRVAVERILDAGDDVSIVGRDFEIAATQHTSRFQASVWHLSRCGGGGNIANRFPRQNVLRQAVWNCAKRVTGSAVDFNGRFTKTKNKRKQNWPSFNAE